MPPDITEHDDEVDDSPNDQAPVAFDGEKLKQERNAHFLTLAKPKEGYENDAIAQWVEVLAKDIVNDTEREQAIRTLTMLSRADVSTHKTINTLLAKIYGPNAIHYGVMENPELVAKYNNTELTKTERIQSNSASITQGAIVIFLNFFQTISDYDKLLSFATKPLLILRDSISINYDLFSLQKENTRSEFEKNFKIVTKNDGRGNRIINNTFKLFGTAALFLGATLAATYIVTAVYLSFFIYTLIDGCKKLSTMKSDIKLLEKTLDDITSTEAEISSKDQERLNKALISMQETRALEKEKVCINLITINAIIAGASLLATPLAPIGLMLMAGAPILQAIYAVITKLTREKTEPNRHPSFFDKRFRSNTKENAFIRGGGSETPKSETPKVESRNLIGGCSNAN